MSSSSLKEGKMLHQPRFSIAIQRVTLVLLALCLYGTLALAAPNENSVANSTTVTTVGLSTPTTQSEAVGSLRGSTPGASVEQSPIAMSQQPAAAASPTPNKGVGISPAKAQQSEQSQRYGEP